MSRLLTAAGAAAVCAVLVGAAGCADDGTQVRTDQTAATGAGSGSLNEQDLGGPAKTKQLQAAVDSYRSYVLGEVGKLRTATTAFTDAVRAADLVKAKSLFAPSRYSWETIVPIAGLVPGIDVLVDGRVEDYSAPDDPEFSGWHRLEYLLWVKGTTAGTVQLANQLDTVLADLQGQIDKVALTPATLVSTATALVKEVAARKLAGAEDRYSHTDLSDLAGNIEGSQAILRTLTPVLQAKDSALYNSLLRNFASAGVTLGRYRFGGGTYRQYTALGATDRQALTAQLNALAADWAKVGPALAA